MVKIVAYWSTLFHYAALVTKARKSGTTEEIERAEINHKHYEAMCLRADQIL